MLCNIVYHGALLPSYPPQELFVPLAIACGGMQTLLGRPDYQSFQCDRCEGNTYTVVTFKKHLGYPFTKPSITTGRNAPSRNAPIIKVWIEELIARFLCDEVHSLPTLCQIDLILY